MTEEELDAAGALAVDEDQDELMEEMSIEERKERLKKARWNVFLYLGVAAILFGFALFPMPFSADYDDFSKSAEKDIGFVWGLPIDGEDLFDVPMRLTVTADNPPAQSAINIAVYVIQQEDCTDFTLSEKMLEAKAGDSHDHQYQEAADRVLADGTYDFEFNIDPGQYCLIVEYINGDGENLDGRDQAQAPAYQFYVAADYQLFDAVRLNLNIEGRDEYYFSDGHEEQSPSYALVNAALAYEVNNWELSFWGRNLNDKDYFLRGFSFPNDPRDGYSNTRWTQLGSPRQFGISATASF